MTVRQKCLAARLLGGISLMTIAVTFSACVPVESPPAKTRLNYVSHSENGTGEALKSWDSTTGQITDVASANFEDGAILLAAGQPQGGALMYLLGIRVGYLFLGNIYTSAENAAGEYVRKPISVGLQWVGWSPDGAHIASIDGETLYIRPTNGAPYAVGSAVSVGWSPDGRKIIYQKPATEAGALHIHDVVSRQDSQIADNLPDNIGTGLWLPDNRHVVTTSAGGQHFLIDTAEPAPVTVREIPAQPSTFFIVPSPTSDRFLASNHETSAPNETSLSFIDGRSQVLFSDALSRPVWSATGDHIYYVADSNNDSKLELVVADPDGKTQQNHVLPASTSDTFEIVYSPQNDQLALVRVNSNSTQVQLTLIAAPSGNLRTFDPAPSAANKIAAKWSPDGRFLAYGTGGSNLYLYDGSASNPAPESLDIANAGNRLELDSWSRDSSYIAVCNLSDASACHPIVISVTPGNRAIIELPDAALQELVWTGK